jgi:hypothetical protein
LWLSAIQLKRLGFATELSFLELISFSFCGLFLERLSVQVSWASKVREGSERQGGRGSEGEERDKVMCFPWLSLYQALLRD